MNLTETALSRAERELDAARAEVEHLTANRDAFRRALERVEDALGIERTLDLFEPQRAVQRLRAEVERLTRSRDTWKARTDAALNHVRERDADNERLREALDEVARRASVGPPDPPGPKSNGWYDRLVELGAFARAALAGAPSETRREQAQSFFAGMAQHEDAGSAFAALSMDERRALAERVREAIADRIEAFGWGEREVRSIRAIDLDALLGES